ncbi:MAG: DsrE family protein [Nitrososphaerota archaeon]
MAGILFVIVSGPNEFEKARQGLRAARNLKRGRLVEDVRVFFVGPGVLLLDRENENYGLVEEFLQAYKQYGVRASACAGNLRVYGLEEKIDKNLVIADDTAAVLAEAVAEGLTIATF